MFTRFKLNSINYGGRFLAAIGFFGLAIPAAAYAVEQVLVLFEVRWSWLRFIQFGSALIGVGLLGLFAILLMIEFWQDAHLDRHYSQTRNRKLKISDDEFECQYCGFRKIKKSDRRCPACGRELF